MTLPFSFPYFCRSYTTAAVTSFGAVVVGATTPPANPGNPNAAHGQNPITYGAFPYASTGDYNGLIAVHSTVWSKVNDGSSDTGYAYTWTTGTAPNRHFVISWDNPDITPGNGHRVTLQCQLYEGSGRIVIAHSSGWVSQGQAAWACGIDSVIDDTRYVVPSNFDNGFTNNYAYTGADLVFDSITTTVTGRVLYDKLVDDASGIGNSVAPAVPLAGLAVQARRASDGLVYAGGTVAGDGTFSFSGFALPPTFSVGVLAQNAAVNVVPSAGGLTSAWSVVASQAPAANVDLGTRTLGLSADSNGDLRGALNVALDCGAAYAWASPKTADTIPRVDVVLDATSNSPTAYAKAVGQTPASITVGSRLASNPDAWDDAVVTKVYGRHVLASIAGAPSTAYDGRFDAVTDPQNAFAEGFGCYLWAAVSGTSTVVDATSASTAIVDDLETPTITVTKGPDVAGCAAGALFDLLDPANETTDPVDGTSAPDAVFRVCDAITAAPTTPTFLAAWIASGRDGPGASRVLVTNHALVDDAYEPNDSPAEAAAFGAAPLLHPGLVLNQANQDWFSVTLAADAAAIAADAKFDAVSTGAVVVLEIRDAAGTLVATGAPGAGVAHAAGGPAPAGTYKIGARHVSGGPIPTYSFQAYVPPAMDAAPIRDWTVGRDYDLALGVRDGMPPYALSTPSSAMPPGLALNSTTLHASGRPTTVGAYEVTVQLRDSGDPANVVSRSQTVTIHDVLKLPLAPFVAFPAGQAIDATLPTHEGTPPFALTSTGTLPSGLAFDAGTFHVAGTAAAQPSVALSLDGVDVAGSADHVDLRALVAVQLTGKSTPANLVAGTDACGWWFDAVEGSTVSFGVSTAKKQAKRALTGILLAPDRSAVAGGKIVGKLGAVAASKLVCPASGRYCFVASTTDAGAATQLVATLSVALPKSGKGADAAFDPSATTTVSFGALPGSTVTLKFAGDAKHQLVAKVLSVTDPTGAAQNFAPSVKATATGGTLTMTLPVGGTWTVVLGATAQSTTPGKLTYSYALKQSKTGTYVAE